MSGCYTELQARIRQLNKLAIYVFSAAYSLNLLGVKVSASAHRWNLLASSLEEDHVVVNRLPDTKWPSHFDAVLALAEG